MTPAGKFRYLAQVQQRAAGRDEIGADSGAWSLFAERLASVEPLRGREFFAAAQMQSSVDYRVKLRKPLSLESHMRIVVNGKTMDIVSMIEHDDEWELMCSTGIRNAL